MAFKDTVYYGDQHSRRRVYGMGNGDSGTHLVPSSWIKITPSTLELSTLYNDNQASLSTFTDTAYKPQSKNVGVRVCQIREIIEDRKEVVMDFCSTERMVADGRTKPLVGVKHVVFVKMGGLS